VWRQTGVCSGKKGPRWKFFKQAEGDTVGLAEGTVEGAGFGRGHFGVVKDQRRDIAGMSISVADEAAALGRFIDRGFKHPKVLLRMTESNNRFAMNTTALVPLGKTQ
jgi:hypothetical protein